MYRYLILTLCLLSLGFQDMTAQTGNVGIGTDSPQRPLHIFRASAGPFASSSNTTAVLESDQDNYLSLFNPLSQENGVLFGFPSSAASGGVLYNSNNSLGLQFRTNGNIARMVIDSIGQVGIGTLTPKRPLHIFRGSAGTFASSTSTTAVFESDQSNFISLLNPEADENGILFGFPSSAASGGVLYNSSNSPKGLQFRANGNISRMVIDSSGKVGIGINPQRSLHVFRGPAGTFASSVNSTAVFESNQDNYISMFSPSTNASGVLFGNPSSANSGGVLYNAGTNQNGLEFRTNGNIPRMFITNIGDVGINDVSPIATLSVKAKSNDVRILRVMDSFGQPVLDALSSGSFGINQVYNDITFTVQGKSGHDNIMTVENSSGIDLLILRNDGLSSIGGPTELETKLTINNLEGFNEVLKIRNSSDDRIMQCSNDGTSDFFGQVTKPLGSFKIDHPLDPENKYLYHSFVESPDMMNIYNGNITTDAEGRATVDLPDYFEALNMEFRYQLTVIGSFAQAIIQEEVQKNQFVIATNEPNVKVSWQVTGIRHDPYANEHRIPNSIDKAPEDKGTYLYPEVYGKPTSQSERHTKE